MIIRVIIFLIIIGAQFHAYSQNSSWMTPPIKHKIGLSGTFGELRSNHFHTGIDIKSSNGRIGDPIIAIADGVVSRIGIKKDGYGNALYIDHPNGKTSVYGHLHTFTPEINQWINTQQHDLESFEIDTIISDSLFVFQKGDVIGKMGNSGSSGGPHLHFEIRDTESELALNPLMHGIKVLDKAPPHIETLRFYVLDNKLNELNAINFKAKKIDRNNYTLENGTVKIPAWRTNIAVLVRDLMTGVSNRNGIYSLKLTVDEEEFMSFTMDSISFKHAGYCNAHTDYAYAKKFNKRMHRAYLLEGNRINLYESNTNSIKLYADIPRHLALYTSDYNGNVSIVKFKILRDTNMMEHNPQVFNYVLKYDEVNLIDYNENLKLYFPGNVFYRDQLISIHEVTERNDEWKSNIYHIHKNTTPVHKPYQIRIKPFKSVPDTLYSKLCIVTCSDKNMKSFGGNISQGMVTAEINELGPIALTIDTIAPNIVEKSFPYQVQRNTTISFEIDDNMIASHNAKDLSYRAEIDDKWILMKYDYKKKKIYHQFDDSLPNGKHHFTLKVTDDRNNTSNYEKVFIKK